MTTANQSSITAYPLAWPSGQPRRLAHLRSHNWFFSKSRTISVARDELLRELDRLGATRVVISSNLRLRGDGLPMGNQAQPADPAVAIYFKLDGQPVVLACDLWDKVEQNMWAIRLHIEALRGTERWGVGRANQAFTGYRSLPAPRTDAAMSVEQAADTIVRMGGGDREKIIRDPDVAREAYRRAAGSTHPDRYPHLEEDFKLLQEAKRVLDEYRRH